MKKIINPPKNEWLAILKRPTQTIEAVENTVTSIFDDVRRNGNDGVKRYTEIFDGVSLDDLCVSAKITPMPCVPSNNLITTGAPPTCSNTLSIFFGIDAKAVLGIPKPAFANNCKLRSLSRERTNACDSTEEKTFICSN